VIAAVLDANVLAPGLVNQANAASKTGEIVHRWPRGEVVVAASIHLVEEVQRVLATKRYFLSRLSKTQRDAIRADLPDLVHLIDVGEVVAGVAPHRRDGPVLAAVAAAGADWFVTGDAGLLAMGSYAGVPFADPAAFLAVLDAVPKP